MRSLWPALCLVLPSPLQAQDIPVSESRPWSIEAFPKTRHDTLPAKRLNQPVKICSGGDVLLGTNLGYQVLAITPDTLVMPLIPLFEQADIALINIEGAIGQGRVPSKCSGSSGNCFAFRMPPSAAIALRSLNPLGAVVGNIANNHSHDAGKLGHLQTAKHLSTAGITVTGLDTIPSLVPLPSGDTVAFFGFHTSKDTPDARDTALVRRLVTRASIRWPLVVVTMHLGGEGQNRNRVRDRSETFLGTNRGNPIAFAEAAVSAGAALVVGHGPHELRGIEWRPGGALIAYSLGNLLTYGPFSMKRNGNLGGILCTEFDTTARISAASFTSTVQSKAGLLSVDSTYQSAKLLQHLSSRDFKL